MISDIITKGRSVGKVDEPAVQPRLPTISDDEVNEAAEELGLVKLRSSHIKCLRRLGQSVKSTGAVSVARGMTMFANAHLMDLVQKSSDAAEETDDIESKTKLMALRKDASHEILVAAKIIFESEAAKPALPQLKEEDLEEVGAYVQNSKGLTQVAVAGDLHVH